jgi:hypothetical protein
MAAKPIRMSCEVSAAVQPRRPTPAVAATTTWKQFPASDGVVVRSVDGDWHESPAQLQALIFCRLQQARPGDA